MSSGAQFMGGPAHGRIYAFPGDKPPAEVVIQTAPPLLVADATEDPTAPVTAVQHVYRRQVSSLDDGPLWVLVYVAGPEGDA